MSCDLIECDAVKKIMRKSIVRVCVREERERERRESVSNKECGIIVEVREMGFLFRFENWTL